MPATFFLMMDNKILNPDIAARKRSIVIMAICRMRICPSCVWMMSYEDSENFQNRLRKRRRYPAAASGGPGRAGKSSGKWWVQPVVEASCIVSTMVCIAGGVARIGSPGGSFGDMRMDH